MTKEEKSALIAEMHNRRSDPSMTLILKMFDATIEETRIMNDTVLPDSLQINQGIILICQELKDRILRGLPTQVPPKQGQ
ncbi:MAG: hypothetical protein WC294_00140 [Methanoregula sp.]|jgi:hypothetical protein